MREQGLRRGCAEENSVSLPHMFLKMDIPILKPSAQNAELEFGVFFPDGFPFGQGIVVIHELLGAGEGAVDDVDVVDLASLEEEGEADVPEGLAARAEDGDGVDFFALGEDDGGGEGGAEGRQGFGGEEGGWGAIEG